MQSSTHDFDFKSIAISEAMRLVSTRFSNLPLNLSVDGFRSQQKWKKKWNRSLSEESSDPYSLCYSLLHHR